MLDRPLSVFQLPLLASVLLIGCQAQPPRITGDPIVDARLAIAKLAPDQSARLRPAFEVYRDDYARVIAGLEQWTRQNQVQESELREQGSLKRRIEAAFIIYGRALEYVASELEGPRDRLCLATYPVLEFEQAEQFEGRANTCLDFYGPYLAAPLDVYREIICGVPLPQPQFAKIASLIRTRLRQARSDPAIRGPWHTLSRGAQASQPDQAALNRLAMQLLRDDVATRKAIRDEVLGLLTPTQREAVERARREKSLEEARRMLQGFEKSCGRVKLSETQRLRIDEMILDARREAGDLDPEDFLARSEILCRLADNVRAKVLTTQQAEELEPLSTTERLWTD